MDDEIDNFLPDYDEDYERERINGDERLTVHSLVAKFYLPPRPSTRHEIRHLDGNKMNACMENLAWGTQKNNADDRERHGRTSRGKKHSQAIRSSNQADAVRDYFSKKRVMQYV